MGAIGEKPEVTAGAPHLLPHQRWRALHHHTGEVSPGNPRQRGVRKAAEHVFNIAGVQARSLDLYQHFTGGRCRRGDLDDTQGSEVASGGKLQRFHG